MEMGTTAFHPDEGVSPPFPTHLRQGVEGTAVALVSNIKQTDRSIGVCCVALPHIRLRVPCSVSVSHFWAFCCASRRVFCRVGLSCFQPLVAMFRLYPVISLNANLVLHLIPFWEVVADPGKQWSCVRWLVGA